MYKREQRRWQGYDKSLPQLIPESDTGLRGHNKKLYQETFEKDIRKYNFNIRVCRLWNSLPEDLVNAKDVLAFEKGLDAHWHDQDLMYNNHKAAIKIKGKVEQHCTITACNSCTK